MGEYLSTLELLQRIHPEVLEKLVAELFHKMDCEVSYVGGPADKGIDLIVTCPTPTGLKVKYGIQVKRRISTRKVGYRELRTFIIALEHAKISHGIFITTSDFTYDAIEDLKRNEKWRENIQLWNGYKLLELLKRYGIDLRSYAVMTLSLNEQEKERTEPTIRRKRARKTIRVRELDTPLILRYEWLELKERLDELLRKYGCSEYEVNSATLRVKPCYVIDWEARYIGVDAQGRKRLRKATGRALVLDEEVLDIKDSGWIGEEVLKKMKLKYDKVEASSIIKEKGISQFTALKMLKDDVSSKYNCSPKDVRYKRIKKFYLGHEWILEFMVSEYNSGTFRFNLIDNEGYLELEPIEEEVLIDIVSKAVSDKTGESIIGASITSEGKFISVVSCETSRFKALVKINKYTGKVLDVKTRIKPDAAQLLAKSLVSGAEIIGVEEHEDKIIIDLEDDEHLHVVTINAEDGTYNLDKGLLGRGGASDRAINMLSVKYNVHEARVIGIKLRNHRFWEVELDSPDGKAKVVVDAKTNDIVRHKIVFSEQRVKSTIRRLYPDKEIMEVKYHPDKEEYFVKSHDQKYIHELVVDATSLKTSEKRRYLKPNVVEQLYRDYISSKYKPKELKVIEIRFSKKKPNTYVAKLMDEKETIYYSFIDAKTGNILEEDVLVKQKGIFGALKTGGKKLILEAKYQ